MNVTPPKISAAIAQALEETFPGETVYHDIVRRDFARPSSLVVLGKVELDPLSVGMAAVGLRYHYKLTTFTKVDEVHDSHLPELTARALKVQSATAATGGYDAAEVSVVLTLTVDRGEFTPGEMLDIMRALNTRFETKEEEI